MGIPFGIGKMCVWMVPRGFDLGGTLAVWIMNFSDRRIDRKCRSSGNGWTGNHFIFSVFLLTVITGIHKIPRIK